MVLMSPKNEWSMKNHLELEIPEKYILKKKKKGPSGI